MKKLTIPLIIILFSLISCTKDREFTAPLVIIPPSDSIVPGSLLINEFIASGSVNSSTDFGIPSDWIELYNPGNDTLKLKASDWIISDSVEVGQNDEYQFTKDTIVLPKQFLMIWCDSRDTVITEIHTPFNLSAGGEAIGLFYKDSSGAYITIDSHTFGQQTSGKSSGRIPDGGPWSLQTLNPTPGAPNN